MLTEVVARYLKISGLAVGAIVLVALTHPYWRARPPMPDTPSVVIVPARVSGDPSFLSDAIPATLSAQLSGVPELEMKPPPTSTEFAEVGGDYRKVSLAYAVNLVVVPELKGDAGSFELKLQAIDPVTHNVLWNDSYKGSRAQYLEWMRTASDGVRRAVRSSSKGGTSARDAGGSEAELAYREGAYHLDQYQHGQDPAAFAAGLQSFQGALAANPELANAAAGISRLFVLRDPASPEGETWARRALEIDPRCGRAFFVLAGISRHLDDALRAAAFAPDYALAHLALGQSIGQSSNLAFAASRQARQLDPLYLYAPLAEAGYLHQLGRTSEAFAILDRQVVGINPGMSYGRWTETSLMMELGWLDRADVSFKDIDKVLASQPPMPYAMGDVRRVPTLARNGYIDDSFDLLRRAMQSGAPIPYDWLRLDRRLDRLRVDPRFVSIQEYSRTQFEAMLKTLDDAKERGELPPYLQQPLAELRNRLGS